MSPEDISRRRDGKRFNERVKLIATFANNSGIAILVGVVVLPYVTAGATNAAWLVAPLVLHGAGQVALTFLRSED